MSTTNQTKPFRILIYRGINCWMSDMSKADNANDCWEIFGTDQIPTAFTLNAPLPEVVEAIRKLNPNHQILT